MSLVPCPDGGKCGSSKHRPGSNAYNWCSYKASARARHQGKSRIAQCVPLSANDAQRRARREYMKLAKERSVYSVADCIVTEDMVIPERSVQSYINDPTKINDTYRKKWEDDIRKNIQEKSEGILAKLGLDADDLDDDELDIVMDAVYHADNSDIAGAEAKNMKPRTFTHFCSPTEMGRRAAFDKAMQKYEVGSDEWYDALADGYHRDLKDSHLRYPGRAGMGGSKGDEDRRAIESALRQAFDDDLDDIDYYDLPSIEVVWTGNLSDVGPNDDDGSSEKLHVMYPHFVLTDGMGGIFNDPVRLHGDYVIDLPSREDRRHGAESGILDDMTMKRGGFFDYPDGVGLAQYSAADVYRTFE